MPNVGSLVGVSSKKLGDKKELTPNVMVHVE